MDSSAALAIVDRKGNGRLRHVRVGHLWLQEKDENEELQFRKVAGTENPADLRTKYLSADRAQALAESMQQHRAEAKSAEGLTLNAILTRAANAGGSRVIMRDPAEGECLARTLVLPVSCGVP